MWMTQRHEVGDSWPRPVDFISVTCRAWTSNLENPIARANVNNWVWTSNFKCLIITKTITTIPNLRFQEAYWSEILTIIGLQKSKFKYLIQIKPKHGNSKTRYESLANKKSNINISIVDVQFVKTSSMGIQKSTLKNQIQQLYSKHQRNLCEWYRLYKRETLAYEPQSLPPEFGYLVWKIWLCRFKGDTHTHTQRTPKPSKTYNYLGLRAESWVRLFGKPSKKRVFLRRQMQVTQLCIPEWIGRR